MAQITTHERVRCCPLCESTDLVRDYEREETYCNNCGLIISSAVQYVGGQKFETPQPHSPSYSARKGVHYNFVEEEDKAKLNNRRTTRYKHNMTNRQLMKKGRG